ncbi:MAG: hypothetical protein CENE_00155 [Candidatus Celerinatantimonas neptuna]|nr:MAG: hypothetical protein CENE_00155 [Candidatus Celerinatantimonas neptuna]
MLKKFDSPLLRLILLATGLLVAVQTIIIGYSSFLQIKQLQIHLEAKLHKNTQSIQTLLQQNKTEQLSHLRKARKQISDEMDQSLNQFFTQQQQSISSHQLKQFKQEAQNYNRLIVSSATEAILDNNLVQMTNLIIATQQNPNVIVAAFVSSKGKLLTHSLNRSRNKVQQLDIKGKGPNALTRVLTEAAKDPTIYFTITPVMFQGSQIGTLKVGYDMADFNQAQKRQTEQALAAREKIVHNSKILLTRMGKSSANELTQLANTLLKMNQNNTHHLINDIQALAKSVTNKSLTIQIAGGIILLIAIAIFFIAKIQRRLKRLSTNLMTLAEGGGDLTQKVQIIGKDEIATMGDSVNRFLQTTRELVQKVNHNSVATQQKIEHLTENSETAHQQSSNQQQELDQVNEAIREASQAIDEETRAVLDIQQHVDTLKQTNQKSQQLSNDVGELIQRLGQGINEANTEVDNFVKLSDQIGSVLNVIQAIAEQTNLLALNAAIEAARAGDNGRGFAVVADEVRHLAAKTQESTGQIQQSINELQDGAQRSSSAMGRATEHAHNSIEQLHEATHMQQEVSQSVDSLVQFIHQIAAMAEQQNASSAQIAQSAQRMREQSSMTTDAVTNTRQRSQELQDLSEQLMKAMSAFTV